MALMGHINLHRGNEKARFDFHQNELFSVPDGGDKRDRTADLLNAIQALSQLSYTPMFTFSECSCSESCCFCVTFKILTNNF